MAMRSMATMRSKTPTTSKSILNVVLSSATSLTGSVKTSCVGFS